MRKWASQALGKAPRRHSPWLSFLEVAGRISAKLLLCKLWIAVDINHRGFNKFVPELILDGQQVSAALEKVRCQRVAEQVRVDALGEPHTLGSGADHFAHALLCS